ncbi:MAG: VWA domain-containing protein [Planctomycetia bacterium]|nr:VWA domain-containing protein [Planctomycetia bacterium]
MNLPQRAQHWWQDLLGDEDGPFDGDAPAWAVSLVIHVVVLLGLALAGLGEPPRTVRNVTVIEAPLAADEEVQLVPQEIAVAEDPQDAQGSESEQSDAVAQSLAPTLSEMSVVPVEVEQDLTSDIVLEPVDELPTAQAIDVAVVVKGAAGVGTTGAAGAVDHLTAEISASLAQRPTVVCWVFDQSVSLSAQRRQIADRLDRVFEELGANRSSARRPGLTNMVVAFGQNVTLVTKQPTDEVGEVVKAIESIPVDDSGAEMTFTAIRRTAEAARIFRTSSPKKNVMIVVFTDEVGNDQDKADDTTKYCVTLGIPVYVVGVPAPFGIAEVRMKYVEFDPKYAQDEQWAVIEQGPETLFPEVVRVRSGRYADDAIDSGFGPFSLSKLCADTGGIYFRVHANSGERGRVTNDKIAPMSSQLRYFFDPDVMRAYQPDYVSQAKLKQELADNRAKQVLVEAARKSVVEPMEAPEMTFPRKDEGTLKTLLGDAQKTAARIQPRIDALYELLKSGQSDRERIQEKRWRAGYDLALGRVLAVKVRTDAYNLMLAQASLGMNFKNPKSDTWKLVPSDEVKVGSATEKLARQALELLTRVVNDHPGTPWAMLAAEELRTPLGYEWTETFTDASGSKGMQGNNPNPPTARADDKKKMLGPPKPKRDLKRL